MNAPPPIPSKSSVRRDITQPLVVGEDVDVYQVAICTPDVLRLKVSTGFYFISAIVCSVAAVLLFLFWKATERHETVYDHASNRGLIGAIIAAILAIGSVMNLGRSLEINRPARRLETTRFFFFTKNHALDGITAVRIEIASPTASSSSSAKQTDPPSTSALIAAAISNNATLSLVGIDSGGQPCVLSIASSNLHATSLWPSMAAAGLQISRLLQLPLHVEGAVDQAPAAVIEDVRRLRSL